MNVLKAVKLELFTHFEVVFAYAKSLFYQQNLVMRAIIQRVSEASVKINGEMHGEIKHGLLILLGVGKEDQQDDLHWLVNKITDLRIFSDKAGKMNLSVQDVEGSCLVVSQFTLHAKTKKGTRPSFIHAAPPDQAIPLYEKFIEALKTKKIAEVQTGKFGADMKVQLINDGPVTILLDTKNKE